MGEHSTLALVCLLVNGGVGAVLVFCGPEGGVEDGLLHVGVWAVNGLEASV